MAKKEVRIHPMVSNEKLLGALDLVGKALKTGLISENKFKMQCIVMHNHDEEPEGKPETFCGTVACIGGWVGLVLGFDYNKTRQFVKQTPQDTALRRLFYPDREAAWNASPKVAGNRALRFVEKYS